MNATNVERKEFFNYVMQSEYYGLKTPEGKKQDYETVICKPCISEKIRLDKLIKFNEENIEYYYLMKG